MDRKITDSAERAAILEKELAFWMDVEKAAKAIKLQEFKQARARNPIRARPRKKRKKR